MPLGDDSASVREIPKKILLKCNFQFTVANNRRVKPFFCLLLGEGGVQRFLGNMEIEGSGTHERLERKNHGESQNRRGKRGEVQPMAFKK